MLRRGVVIMFLEDFAEQHLAGRQIEPYMSGYGDQIQFIVRYLCLRTRVTCALIDVNSGSSRSARIWSQKQVVETSGRPDY